MKKARKSNAWILNFFLLHLAFFKTKLVNNLLTVPSLLNIGEKGVEPKVQDSITVDSTVVHKWR